VLVGPYTFNFDEITLSLLEHGGATRVTDHVALAQRVLALLDDEPQRQRMGCAAQAVFDRERGAVERIMQMVDATLQE
jgi:3-deoxy-D-manno-octulosonic-acid transferase